MCPIKSCLPPASTYSSQYRRSSTPRRDTDEYDQSLTWWSSACSSMSGMVQYFTYFYFICNYNSPFCCVLCVFSAFFTHVFFFVFTEGPYTLYNVTEFFVYLCFLLFLRFFRVFLRVFCVFTHVFCFLCAFSVLFVTHHKIFTQSELRFLRKTKIALKFCRMVKSLKF